LTSEEGALGNAGVFHAGFADAQSVVLQVVEDVDFADSEILEARFDHALLEVAFELEHLFVKLYEGGLELFLDVSVSKVVLEDTLREGGACGGLLRNVGLLRRLGHIVERYVCVLGVSDLFQFDVGHFLVLHEGGVVQNGVAG